MCELMNGRDVLGLAKRRDVAIEQDEEEEPPRKRVRLDGVKVTRVGNQRGEPDRKGKKRKRDEDGFIDTVQVDRPMAKLPNRKHKD